MRTNTVFLLSSVSAAAVAFSVPAMASPAPASGFQLPPAPTPTPTAQVQGPVDTRNGVQIPPRVIPSPTPTQTAPSPTPTPTSAPTRAPAATNTAPPRSDQTAAPSVRPTQSPSTSRPQQQAPGRNSGPVLDVPPARPQESSVLPASSTEADSGIATSPLDILPTTPAPVEAQSGLVDSSSGGISNYTMWIGLLTGLIILLGGAFVFWRKRQPAAASVPEIEAPTRWVTNSGDAAALPLAMQGADPQPQPTTPAQAPAPASVLPKIQLKAEAISLSRSLMNATLAYRLEIVNSGGEPLTDIAIKADMVSAHGRAPIEEQVASEHTHLGYAALIPKVSAKETHEEKLSANLPVSSIRPITQRGTQLFVPLLRVRIDARGTEPIIHTFVVGTRPQERGGRLQPFRLDEMAQTYRNITFRALD